MASAISKSQEASQAPKHLSKAKDGKEDMTLLLKPHADWEENLKSAALSISILGELILISAVQDDFSISQHPPKDGFKHLKYPDSFKASLAQVTHEAQNVFKDTNTNMDNIHCHSMLVSDELEIILSQDITQAKLQEKLRSIHEIAEKCKKHASDAKGNFRALISLVQELLEACVSAKGIYGQTRKDTQQAIEAADMQTKAKLELNKSREEYEKAWEQYNESMDAIPTGQKVENIVYAKLLGNTFSNVGTAFGIPHAEMFGTFLNHITQDSGTGSRPAEKELLNAQEKQEALKVAQDAYLKSFENFKKQNEELAKIVEDMEKPEVTKIDFEEVQNMLVRGLEALAKVEAHWEKMLDFFIMVFNLINVCLNQDIEKFIITAQDIEKIKNYNLKSFTADIKYHPAFIASIVAELVNMIAGTYCKVSEEHLIDQVTCLERLIKSKPSDPDFKSERSKLIHDCEEARKAISALLAEEKAAFEKKIQARVDAIKTALNAILPVVDKETKEETEAAAN